MSISNKDLISQAKAIVKPKKLRHGFITADCGTALLSENENVFLGVSIDTPSSMGFCSEPSAIASMITNGEYRIKKIVAVLEDGSILPPCGRCREFIYQIDKNNLDTQVIISEEKEVSLKELLPYRWDEESTDE